MTRRGGIPALCDSCKDTSACTWAGLLGDAEGYATADRILSGNIGIDVVCETLRDCMVGCGVWTIEGQLQV